MGAVGSLEVVRRTARARGVHASSCGVHDAPAPVGARAPAGPPACANMRSDRDARRARGFTLLDLMITMVVLAVGVLALGQLMPAGSRSLSRSRSVTTGTTLAAQKLEDLKALAWTNSSLAAGTHSDTSGKYTRTWVITDNTPLAGTRKVAVTVSWPSSTGTRSTVVTTYLTQFAN